MTRRRNGGLSDEDRAIWKRVTEQTNRLHSDKMPAPAPAQTKMQGPPRPALTVKPNGVPPPRPSRVHLDLIPDPMQMTGARNMDQRLFGKLKRGKLAPEARIDLHGMTAERAHGALRGFILRAHGDGLRLVLVITGKGRDRADDGQIAHRKGVLRHAVPQWLGQIPLAPLIMDIAPAHQRHGGGGAYYVYLRRNRQ